MALLKENLEYARLLKDKYEFYFVALSFTILGLSIQTAKPADNCLANILELFSWALLLGSGSFALLRQELRPIVYANSAKLSQLKDDLSDLNLEKSKGVRYGLIKNHTNKKENIDVLIEQRMSIAESESLNLGRYERRIALFYSLHKWLFVLGLSALIIGRGISLFNKVPVNS